MSKPPKPKEQGPEPKRKGSALRNFAALSGIAIEMGVIIYLAAQGGIWLDDHFKTEKRLFTAFCTMAGVGIALWVVLRQIRQIRY